MNEEGLCAAKRAETLALRYLSYRSRTEKEVYDKLCSYNEFEEKDICEAISTVKKYGYLDDRKFAEAFSISKYQTRMDGPFKIKMDLLKRGISAEIADEALNNLKDLGSLSEAESACRLITKKLRGNIGVTIEQKKKIYTYMMRKGFSSAAVREAFQMLGEGAGGEDFCEEYTEDFDLYDC